jgi:hypothetical protein
MSEKEKKNPLFGLTDMEKQKENTFGMFREVQRSSIHSFIKNDK